MPDREKVIKQLESMRDYHRFAGNNITADIADDALALLKEPDNMKWHVFQEYPEWNYNIADDVLALLKEQEPAEQEHAKRILEMIEHALDDCIEFGNGPMTGNELAAKCAKAFFEIRQFLETKSWRC